jgi:hypothetical protein
MEVELEPEGEGTVLTLRWTVGAYVLGFDPYRSWPPGRNLASRFYASVVLPDDAGAVEKVIVRSVTDGSGRTLEHRFPVWAMERRGEERRLHVKVVCPPGAFREAGATAVFRVNPGEAEANAGAAGEEDGDETGPKEGSEGARKALDTTWKIGKRPWVLKDLLEFVESFLAEHGEGYGWGRVTFVFDEDAKSAGEETVTVDLDGRTLREGLADACETLGLAMAVEDGNRVRFSKKGK